MDQKKEQSGLKVLTIWENGQCTLELAFPGKVKCWSLDKYEVLSLVRDLNSYLTKVTPKICTDTSMRRFNFMVSVADEAGYQGPADPGSIALWIDANETLFARFSMANCASEKFRESARAVGYTVPPRLVPPDPAPGPVKGICSYPTCNKPAERQVKNPYSATPEYLRVCAFHAAKFAGASNPAPAITPEMDMGQ